MKNVSDRMLLMAEVKPSQSNMQSGGVLFSWPWPVYYCSALPARERESQLSFSAVAQKLALSGRNAEKVLKIKIENHLHRLTIVSLTVM